MRLLDGRIPQPGGSPCRCRLPTPVPAFEVTADAHGICSHAGVVLLAELADRLGLTSELGRRANLGLARPGGGHAHDRGAVLRDLVVMLADGGDCLRDLAGLRDQAGLFGRVCSTPTAWRVVQQVAADPRGVAGLWSRWRGSASGRGRWARRRGAADASTLTPPCLTPTPTSRARRARSSTASGSTRCWPGWTAATAPARPWRGSCGRATPAPTPPQTTSIVLAMALLALPKRGPDQSDPGPRRHRRRHPRVRRRHRPPQAAVFVGFPLEPDVKAAILAVPSAGPRRRRRLGPGPGPHGRRRPGAWVCELSALDLAGQGWPAGTRAICRRERPHPGAAHKIGFTDHTGHRFQVFITNQPDPEPATLEARHRATAPHPAPPAGRASSATAALEVGHRAHARVEDRIRAAKATGLANLPFSDFDANDVWLTLVLVAQTLVCWAQALLLSGECPRPHVRAHVQAMFGAGRTGRRSRTLGGRQ